MGKFSGMWFFSFLMGFLMGFFLIPSSKQKEREDLAKIREDVVMIGQGKLENDIQEIYKLIAANNTTQGNILDHQGRLLHYIAGHESFVKFCPECGLLEQLEIRRNEIEAKVQELSQFTTENPNDPTTPEKIKEIEQLNSESKEATRRIFHSQQRAKELGPLMKVE